jgi:hypothetical protein
MTVAEDAPDRLTFSSANDRADQDEVPRASAPMTAPRRPAETAVPGGEGEGDVLEGKGQPILDPGVEQLPRKDRRGSRRHG